MTPATNPGELSVIGFTFEKAYIAGPGIILRLQPPAKIALNASEPALPCLHLAFYPVLNVNLPPGVEATPEALQEAAKHATRTIAMQSHEGELPLQIRTECQEPEEFKKLAGFAITGMTPTDDGTNGLNLVFGFQFRLQIDTAGAFVYPIAEGIQV